MAWVLLSFAVAYLAICAVIWFAQERLLFYPQPLAGEARPPSGWRLEAVRHTAADGTVLEGVLVLPPASRPPLVIYYGGNAEEATVSAAEVEQRYGARAVLLMNYRGYGRSGGRPSERALVHDALELYDAVVARKDLATEHVVLHGRSLGTGVAVQVASQRPACRVALTSPYARVTDVAGEIYPWLPVRWLARHPFDSISRAPKVSTPLMVFIAEGDTLIPPKHSERLAAAWGGPVERVRLPDRGHDDVIADPHYFERLRAFVAACA